MTARVLTFRRTITAMEIGEQSANKPLRKFGAAILVRSPVREGRALAERMANDDPAGPEKVA